MCFARLRYGFIPACALLAAATVAQTAQALTIGIIGDSTVSNYAQGSALRGWGQLIVEFVPEGATVLNEAVSGASTKTYSQTLWNSLLAAQPDYVLIQFGHNDSHAVGNPESTDPATDFRDNLRSFITSARDAGVIPVLVTPVHRRLFDENDQLRPTRLTLYADAMHAVAAEMGVSLIDLHASSAVLFNSLGDVASTAFTVNTNNDRTHFTEYGAREIARLIAADPVFAAIVPEPSHVALVLAGAAGLGLLRRRVRAKRKNA